MAIKIPRASLFSLLLAAAALIQTAPVAAASTPSEQPAAANLLAKNSLQDRESDEVEKLLRQATDNSTGPSDQGSSDSVTSDDWQKKPAEAHKLLELLFWPFMACLVLTGIHCYLGIHVVARGVIFVDLA